MVVDLQKEEEFNNKKENNTIEGKALIHGALYNNK
jgi:hypothetical protein